MANNEYDTDMPNQEDRPPLSAYDDPEFIPNDEEDSNIQIPEEYFNEISVQDNISENKPEADEVPFVPDEKKGYEQISDNIYKSLDEDAENLHDLEKNNGINIDNNEPTENIKPEEETYEPSFNLSNRDYKSLDQFSSFRGDNLAVSDGDKVNEYIKSEGLYDKITSLQDMSPEDKESFKELVFQESETISGQLGFPKDRLYQEIGNEKFSIDKEHNPDVNKSDMVSDKDNLSEDAEKAKEDEMQKQRMDKPSNQQSTAETIQTMVNAFFNKRNIHNKTVIEKNINNVGINEMSLTEQTNHFNQMNKDMDYIKIQMERYEKNVEKHKEMNKEFESNKDSLTPEQSKIEQEKLKKLNGENNKQKIAIERQMDDMSPNLDDISKNHDPKYKFNEKSPHDQKTLKSMSKTMKETEKRAKELSDITNRLETKEMINSKKSSGFSKSLKNVGDNIGKTIKDISKALSNAISSLTPGR